MTRRNRHLHGQRRRAGTGQVQRTGPPLVGPGKRIPAAAPDQPAAARLDRRAGAAARQDRCSTSAAAAASWPRRWRGAARACSASTWRPSRCGVARLHALEAGVANVDYREVAPRRWPPSSRQLRRRDLHGDARTRARPGGRRARLRAAGEAGRLGVLLDDQPQPEVVSCSAIVGAEYVLRAAAAGTHEYARFIRPSELARWCRDAGLELLDTSRHANTTR